MTPFALLKTRRFAPHFTCMALGAFNDNYYKNALIILITYALADAMHIRVATFISLSAAVFIIPFFLFSGVAGLMADRYPKHLLIRLLKITELALFIFAGLALMLHNVWFLLAMLFLLGMQAACFGPVKYAILPELLEEKELLAGNGMVEAGTFFCILMGTLLGGLLVMAPHGVELVAASMIALGIVGVVASIYVPHTKAVHPELPLSFNIFKTTWNMVRYAFSTPALFVAIISISWFWAIGATYLTQLPIFTKMIVGGDEEIVTLFNGIFSIGIGIGSLGCHRLLKGTVSLKYASRSLLIIALAGVDLYIASRTMATPQGALLSFADYFTQFAHFRIVFDLSVIAIAGGVFIVPLYTTLQVQSDAANRARTIASNNVMNAFFVAIASLTATGMYAAGLRVEHVLVSFSLASLPLIVLLWRWR
jgi:predicted MFS family arabinose efflux permease